MKTARFSEIVKSAGRPETYPLWIDPKKDRAFQAALKAHRVMSVHQETVGAKADYGAVGYDGDKHAQVLVFPKSIAKFAGRKIVGVKYDQLEALEEGPPKPKPARRKAKTSKPVGARPQDAPRDSEPNIPEDEEEADVPGQKEVASSSTSESATKELRAGIRKAMKQLDAGKAVAAYKTLEKLLVPT